MPFSPNTLNRFGIAAAGLPKTHAKLRAIEAGQVAQLRRMGIGDSLYHSPDARIQPLLELCYGSAGYWAATWAQAQQGSGYVTVAGGAAFTAGTDYGISPNGGGASLSAAGHAVRAERLNTNNSFDAWRPNITPAQDANAYVPNANRVVVVAKAWGALTGAVIKLQTAPDGATWTDVVGGTAIVVTASTAAQITVINLAAPVAVGKNIRAVWVSGVGCVVTYLGLETTLSSGVVYLDSARGGETLANMAGAPDAQAIINAFAPDVMTMEGLNDSLATMAAALTTLEALLPATNPDRIYRTVAQYSTGWAADPTDSRNTLWKQRAAAAGGVLIDYSPYSRGVWFNGYAYTKAAAAGLMRDGTHPNNLFWASAYISEIECYSPAVAAVARVLQPTLGTTTVAGNLILGAVGNGLQVREGANGRQGNDTLAAGTKTIANTSITATTRVKLQRGALNASTAIAELRYTLNAGVGFTVTATRAATLATETGDVSSFDYFLSEPAPAPLE